MNASRPQKPTFRDPPPPAYGAWPSEYNERAQREGHESWEAWCLAVQAERRRRICGCRTKAKFAPCRMPPMSSNGRCKNHGARAVKGVSHYNFKTGSSSKYVPQGLVLDFETTFNDPEYLSLRREIALTTAREQDLLRRISKQTQEATTRWRELRDLADGLALAVAAGDQERLMSIAAKLDGVVQEGSTDEDRWRDLERLQEHARKLKATQSQIIKDRDMTLDKDRALALIYWLVSTLKENVKDADVLRIISHRLQDQLNARLHHNPVPLNRIGAGGD